MRLLEAASERCFEGAVAFAMDNSERSENLNNWLESHRCEVRQSVAGFDSVKWQHSSSDFNHRGTEFTEDVT
jgi:hypothetical protein